MNEHERWILETLIENFSTRIGQGLREGKNEHEMLDADDGLSALGEAWVHGYLTAQMSVICGVTTGNPNLSADKIEAIAAVVRDHSDEIAAELYA
ncbi:hypothetical protein [Halobellus sp. GM3]|uniref:hypothetical protein n=1 Tax=Halobellus sp. GM3 TaxID=3458410 RepID=UPI00403D7EC5